jgi:hypothetical protein
MIDRDNSLLPLYHQGTKKRKEAKDVKIPHQLLIVLRHLIVVDLLLLIIIVIIGSTSGTNSKSNQLSRSQ